MNVLKQETSTVSATQNKPDYTGLRQLKIWNNSVQTYKMTLMKNSGEKIMNLGNSQIGTITVNNGQPYEITFTVPRYYTDDITLDVIKNNEYDYVVQKQLIQINDADKFVIEDIVENDGDGSDGGDIYTMKTVTAYSLDYILNTREIVLPSTERELYTTKAQLNGVETNSNNGSSQVLNEVGYLNLVDEACSWKVNYVDPTILVDTVNGSNFPKVRSVGATNTFVYPFINTTLAPLFNFITFYNSYNKTYDVFNLDSYGAVRPYILSMNNIITDFQKETNISTVITRLHCTGQNNLVFTAINPLGTDYIEDISVYRNSTYMSKGLLEALDRYDILTDNLHKQFLALRSNLTTNQEALDSINTQVDNLKSNQVTYAQEQSALLKTLSSYPKGNITISGNLKSLQTQIQANNTQLAQALEQQDEIQNKLNAINSQLDSIANQYYKPTSRDEQGLIFTPELISEYENFIIEGNYNNTSCITAEELMTQGEKYLKQQVEPVYTFTLSVDDFLQGLAFNEEEKMNITLNLGDKVRVVNKTMNTDTYVRFIGYTVTPETDALTMTFSTLSVQSTPTSTLGGTIANLNNVAQEVNINKYFWNMSKDTANWVENFRTNSLNLVAQEIQSHTEQNIIDINENGIYLIDSNDTKAQLAMTNNIIAMTTDGWETANVAITPYWINGSLICAKTIDVEAFNLSTQEAVQAGQNALDKVGTLTQKFIVAKGELESEIKTKIGEDQMWSDLKENSTEFSSLVGETTAIANVYSQIKQTATSIYETVNDVKDDLTSSIKENANEIETKVSADGFGTELIQNASEVAIAWNKNSDSIEFKDGEIIVNGSKGTVTISGNGGITYSRGSGGSNVSGMSTASFTCQVKVQNGYTQVINLPNIFNGLNLGSDYQFVCWAGNIDSNYAEVFDKDALRNIFVNIVGTNSENGTVSVMPCIQKIGLETLTMWGWDSATTTSGNRQNEGMINIICYATLLTQPIN